jgi:PKD repeat protein
VAFTGTATTGTVSSTSWNFGDGTTSTQQNPIHSYASAGNYTVSLTATGPGGSNTVTSSNLISVTTAASAPVAGAPGCPCNIWSATAQPTVPSDPDTAAVTLGVKFTASQSGSITGIRFYKGYYNTGAHVGTLWTASGQKLAEATFTNETATGWQQVNFSTPVPISANTVYVASYHTNVGRYAGDNNYFANSGVDRGPLHALRSGVSGSNGVYAYGSGIIFPNSSYQSSNYWVDVVFK